MSHTCRASATLPRQLDFEAVESAGKRRARLSTGVLIAGRRRLVARSVFFTTSGTARFALSDAFDEVQLGDHRGAWFARGAICAVLCLLAAAGFVSGRLTGRQPPVAGIVAGVAVLVGFLTWAAAGRDLPFPVANQLAGTLSRPPRSSSARCVGWSANGPEWSTSRSRASS